jgi:hypothetical protein
MAGSTVGIFIVVKPAQESWARVEHMAGVGEVVGAWGRVGFWRRLRARGRLLGNTGKPEVTRGETVVHVLENGRAVLEGRVAVGAGGRWHDR